MPLIKGKAAKSRKGFSENVKREMEAGKPQKQAVAIAYSEAGEKKKAKYKKIGNK
jgi:ribosomal protein L20A (L18A)